jgi:hypothetical protein
LGEAEGGGEEIDKLILRVEQVAIYLCQHVEGILAQGRFDPSILPPSSSLRDGLAGPPAMCHG